MAKTLKLAANLILPIEAVTQTIAILAKRRAGKSYTMRRIVEQLFKAGQQVVLVDPKGDQWGLRSSVDGKSPGLPIVIFGGERGDVPLEVGAGELVAKLVVEDRVSALLDLSLFRKREVATFMTAFLESLYRLKAREAYRTPVMLVIDEADAIAPQKPQDGEERMLGAAEDIVRRGGQRGLGCILVTQRSAVLNKNVLTQAEMLIALRTIAPQDLKAMNEWIDVHGTPEQRKTLMESLPSLPIGDAWFWSPGWPTGDGIFQRVHVLPIETFDSGASPKPGVKPIEVKTLADVDIDAVKGQMADTLERAKADDPKELRRLLAERDREIRAFTDSRKASIQPVGKDVPVLTDADRRLLEKIAGAYREYSTDAADDPLMAALNASVTKQLEQLTAAWFRDLQRRFAGVVQEFNRPALARIIEKLDAAATAAPKVAQPVISNNTANPRRTSPSGPVAAPVRKVVHPSGDGARPAAGVELKAMHRAMLTTLAQHPNGLSKKQILIHTGYASSGPVSTAFADLVKLGAVESIGSGLRITPAGVELLGPYTPLPVGDKLREWLLSSGKLSTMEAALLKTICAAYPSAIRKGQVLEQTGYKSSGPVSSAFAKLVGLNYVRSQGPSMLVASEELFS